jgi:protein TonB
MDVSDVLRDRMTAPSGLQRMLTMSLVAHVAAISVALLLARVGLLGRGSETPRTLMTISLSGAGEGPRNGGMTAAAAQPVQAQRPPEEAPKREAVRPPAAKTPEMALPTNKANARAAKTPAPVAVPQAPEGAKGRTPTRGAQVTPGNAVAYTGARGQGFGLATGGGPGTGSRLDVADFCCPEYIAIMVDRIRSAWQQNQGARGAVVVKFVIQRDGRITDATVENSSGNSTLDLAALRAVMTTRTLNPLPGQYPTLPVHLSFEYQ